jgi:hypothetical protein
MPKCAPKGRTTSAQANEAVKKSLKEQKHFTQRRKVQEGAKKRKQLFFASLCALASLREIVYFFTASTAWVRESAFFLAVRPERAK